MFRFGTAAAAFFIALGLLAAEGPKEGDVNPPYKNWSSFKVGSWAKRKAVVHDTSGDDPNAIDATARPQGAHEEINLFKLVESTPEKVVVTLTQTELDPGTETEHAPVRITYRAKLGKDYAKRIHTKSKVEDFKEGDEALEVNGKKIDCHWVETTIKVGDEASINKIWYSDKIPGGTVKDVTVKKQGDKVYFETIVTLIEYEASPAE
jgi:hypothetical protein